MFLVYSLRIIANLLLYLWYLFGFLFSDHVQVRFWHPSPPGDPSSFCESTFDGELRHHLHVVGDRTLIFLDYSPLELFKWLCEKTLSKDLALCSPWTHAGTKQKKNKRTLNEVDYKVDYNWWTGHRVFFCFCFE